MFPTTRAKTRYIRKAFKFSHTKGGHSSKVTQAHANYFAYRIRGVQKYP